MGSGMAWTSKFAAVKVGRASAPSLTHQIHHSGEYFEVRGVVAEIGRIHQARQVESAVEINEEARRLER